MTRPATRPTARRFATRRSRGRARRGGFSFVEILFAVAVLSIGLIAVAGALYVGVDQTRTSYDETAAASVARQAAAVLGQVMTTDNTSGGNWQRCYSSIGTSAVALRDAMAGSQITAADPRYGWTAVYQKAANGQTAQVTIIVMRSEARPAFDVKDVSQHDFSDPTVPQGGERMPPTLTPADAGTVQIVDNEVQFDSTFDTARLAPDALLVLLDIPGEKTLDGRVLRIGNPESNGRWSLVPGEDLPGVTASGSACVVGRGYADVTQPGKGFAGGNQAIAAYSTIVNLQVVPPSP